MSDPAQVQALVNAAEPMLAEALAAAEAERDRLRGALNQSRLAFAGYVSVQSAIDLIDRASLDPDRLREGVQP